MKKIVYVIFSIFVLLAMPCTFAAVETLNSVVAVVNQDVITQAELNTALVQAKQQLALSPNPNAYSDAALRQMVLQQVIDQKLQLELAKNAKMSISEEQVNQAIAHIAKQNKLSVSELKDKLAQQNVKFSAYKKLIHDQLLVHQVQQSAVAGKVHVTDADLEAAKTMYASQMNTQQTFHVIDILADTQAAAEKIAAQLKNGADIDKAAPNQSTDLGWRTSATLPALFLDQLKNMKTGDISAPIQAPNGYHILKLLGTQGSSAAAPTKQQLQNIAYQMQFQKAVEKWMQEVRKTAYVKSVISDQ